MLVIRKAVQAGFEVHLADLWASSMDRVAGTTNQPLILFIFTI
jgi:hypothetical protein